MSGNGFGFDGDLGIGGNWKAGKRSADHFDRFAAQPARKIEFADAFGQRACRQHEQQRVLTDQHHHFHLLAAFEIFVAMDAAVFAFRDLTADRFAVINLIAIAAEIEPAGIRVLGDHAIRGADIPRLVEFVMARHRKFQHIDRVAFDHVLQHRAVFDIARRQRLHRLNPLVILLDDVDLAFALLRQSEGQRDPPNRREMPVKCAVTGRICRECRRTEARARYRGCAPSAYG